MFTALVLLAAAVSLPPADAPVYVLEHPGIAFGLLPADMYPPVEGLLTDSAGIVQSPPNDTGTEYRVYYWREALDPDIRKGDWLTERLRTVLPPDVLPGLLVSDPNWTEGSMASPHRETASVGLVPTVNFNLIDETGAVLGMGKAAGIFRNGYTVLVYALTPGGSGIDIRARLDTVLSEMYLTGE